MKNYLDMKFVKVKDLKKGDVICFNDWKNDMKVLNVQMSESGVLLDVLYIESEKIGEVLYPASTMVLVIKGKK